VLRTLFVLAVVGAGVLATTQASIYGLLLYLWIAYFRPEVWAWGDTVASLRLSLVVGALLLIATTARGEWRRPTGGIWLLAALVAHSLLSSLLSPYAAFSLPYWRDFAISSLVTYLIYVHARDARRIRWVMVAIVLSLGAEAAKQGFVQLLLEPGAKNFNTHPAIGDENGMAVAMLMLLGLIGPLARTTSRRWERWGYRLIGVGALYRGLATYSRGGLLAAVAFGLAFLVRSRRRALALGLLLAAGGAALVVFPDAFWERMATVRPTEEGEWDASGEGRLHFWGVALRMVASRPVFGVGHNAYIRAYDAQSTAPGSASPASWGWLA
jgi:putative inorganic carbon (HCO3(-)) transporter